MATTMIYVNLAKETFSDDVAALEERQFGAAASGTSARASPFVPSASETRFGRLRPEPAKSTFLLPWGRTATRVLPRLRFGERAARRRWRKEERLFVTRLGC
jgi:hypothetical protein